MIIIPISDDSFEEGGLNDEFEVNGFSAVGGSPCKCAVNNFVESIFSNSDKRMSVVFAINESSSLVFFAIKSGGKQYRSGGSPIAFLTNWSLTNLT